MKLNEFMAAVALFMGAKAFAHHSLASTIGKKTAEIDGTVQKYEWSNPHSWLFLMASTDSGATSYGFEMVSVGELLRRSWAKNSLKPGDRITVKFHPMRDGIPNGLLVSACSAEGVLIGILQTLKIGCCVGTERGWEVVP